MSVLQHPAPGTYSLAGFGPREPIKTSAGWSPSFHRGRDFSYRGQSFDVLAARAGRIRWAYRSELGGNEVLIEHDVPGFAYFATRYTHLHSFAAGIRAGLTVGTQQLLGRAGESGRADGIHLHFELFTDPALGTTQRDPDPFLPTDLGDDDDMAKFTDEHARALDWLDSRRAGLDVMRSMIQQLWNRRTEVSDLADAIDARDVEKLDAEHLAQLLAAELPDDLAEQTARRTLELIGKAATS